jgi:hypothetical protein
MIEAENNSNEFMRSLAEVILLQKVRTSWAYVPTKALGFMYTYQLMYVRKLVNHVTLCKDRTCNTHRCKRGVL